jgi:hypothetical protein
LTESLKVGGKYVEKVSESFSNMFNYIKVAHKGEGKKERGVTIFRSYILFS